MSRRVGSVWRRCCSSGQGLRDSATGGNADRCGCRRTPPSTVDASVCRWQRTGRSPADLGRYAVSGPGTRAHGRHYAGWQEVAARSCSRLGDADQSGLDDLDAQGPLSESACWWRGSTSSSTCGWARCASCSACSISKRCWERLSALLAYETQMGKRGCAWRPCGPAPTIFLSHKARSPEGFRAHDRAWQRTATTLIGKLLGAGLLLSDSPRRVGALQCADGCVAVFVA